MDPETGNIFILTGGAEAIALSPDGKRLWSRSFGEEFAAFTTHGGRTMSPVIDGDLVIVSAAVSNWGSAAARGHRLIALDKRNGDVIYVSNPGGRPYDTAYAPPTIATINGLRLLIAPLGDGGVHAIKVQTGEKVWSYIATKRAINTGVAVSGNNVFISHGDENTEGVELGLVAAIDGSQTGEIKTTKWADPRNRVRLLLADRGRQAAVSDRQRLDAACLRHRHRQVAVDAAARLCAEGVARSRRRQDLRRQRWRLVLHHQAAGRIRARF